MYYVIAYIPVLILEIFGISERLHNLYSSPNIIRWIKKRRMRLAGYIARMGEKRNTYRILVGKPDGKSNGKAKAQGDWMGWYGLD
jgi:hypothetical protein